MYWFMVSIELILILAVFGILVAFFTYYMRSKMTKKNLFKTEIEYEIYCKGHLLKKKSLVLRDGDAYRFGYSRAESYHNNVAIERFMDGVENAEEEILQMKKHYNTWFLVVMDEKQIWLKPSYKLKENLEGHKKVYVRDSRVSGNVRILKDTGEKFSGAVIFASDETETPAFMVRLYDENAVNR